MAPSSPCASTRRPRAHSWRRRTSRSCSRVRGSRYVARLRQALVLPKVESADDLELVAQCAARAHVHRYVSGSRSAAAPVHLILSVESAASLVRMPSLLDDARTRLARHGDVARVAALLFARYARQLTQRGLLCGHRCTAHARPALPAVPPRAAGHDGQGVRRAGDRHGVHRLQGHALPAGRVRGRRAARLRWQAGDPSCAAAVPAARVFAVRQRYAPSLT